MTVRDWQKIKDVFALAHEQPPDRRAHFLREICGDDAELRAEIESLLKAGDAPDPLIEKNNYDIAALLDAPRQNYEGRQFGHYRIIREIGRGGMGAVFLAERADGEFNQQVALKIVRQSFGDTELSRRFRQERQILASLNHPNIARLLDGGISGGGESFLAMEYVEGARVDDYCITNRLTVNETLKLFLAVCEAVAYAHQNLVVHRDIKPSNILVTDEGVPKLLDFGIAKLLDDKHATEQTQTIFRAFTPEYASPEQKSGGRQITTATDVYSLGVLLSNLLAGGGGEQAAEAKKNGEIEPELRSILQMARREEPERRYASVVQFAEDIQRYLDGLPVRAQKDSFAYRAGKFIKRNKITVAAGALVLLSLVTGFAVALWQASIARQERDRAQKRFAEVRQLSNALLTDIAPKMERLQGSTEARQALVNQSLKYLDSLANESGGDLQLQSELAAAYEEVGSLQGDPTKPNLSDYSGAIESLVKAQNIRFAILEKQPENIENRRRLAENFRETSGIRWYQADVSGSLQNSAESLKIYESLTTENPASPDLRTAHLETQIDHAQTYADNNQFTEALPFLRNALSALEELNRGTPNNDEILRLLSKGYARYGISLSWNNRQQEGETEMNKALEIAEPLVARHANDANYRQMLWYIYIQASSLYEGIDDAISFQFSRKAQDVVEETVAMDKANLQARHNLAKTFSRLGVVSVNLNKPSEAVAFLEKSLTILLELEARDPKNTSYKRDLGTLYTRLGDARHKQGDLRGSLAAFEKSVEVFEFTARMDGKNTLAQRNLAQSLKSAGMIKRELARATTGEASLNYLTAARESFQKAFSILVSLREQNALGEFDYALFNEVRLALQKFDSPAPSP